MSVVVLFGFLGLLVGSFLTVLAMRFSPERNVFSSGSVRGRSRCSSCNKILSWYELIPIASFLLQRGQCRSCRAHLSLQYPLIELLCAALWIGVSFVFLDSFEARALVLGSPDWYFFYGRIVLWCLAASALLLIALIDTKEFIIPDELNIGIGILGIGIAILTSIAGSEAAHISSLGFYADVFGFEGKIILGRVAGVLFGLLLFGGLVLITRGRGMGMGDVKLMVALGILFGWPDVLLIGILSFIFGSLYALPLLLRKKVTMKAHVPFGPFIVLASFATFFFGFYILDGYFMLMGGL